MPKVTAIVPQKRNQEYFDIFLDGKFAFTLPAVALVKASLKPEQELSPEKVNSLIKEGDFLLNLDRVLKFLSFRPRSKAETQEYLLKKNVGEETRKMVIKKLYEMKLLDDEAFTKWWIDQRSTFRPEGSRLIKYELERKGVPKEVISGLLTEERPKTTDLMLAEKLAVRKMESLKNLPKIEVKKKLFYALAQRGFSYEIIEQTVAKLLKKE